MDSVGDDALLEDIDDCIELWSSQSQLAMASGHLDSYNKLKNQISNLVDVRYKLSHSTDKATMELAKDNAIILLRHRYEEIQEFFFPRNEVGEILTEQMNASLCRIYEIHTKSSSLWHQNGNYIPEFDGDSFTQDAKESPKLKPAATAGFNYTDRSHILLKLNISGISTGKYLLTAGLWHPQHGFLNEPYQLDISNLPSHFLQPNLMKPVEEQSCIFLDFSSSDIADNPYIILRIYKYHDLIKVAGELKATPGSLKLPHACSVISLSSLNLFNDDAKNQTSLISPLITWYGCVGDDKRFPTIHEAIISGAKSYYTPALKLFDIAITLSIVTSTSTPVVTNGTAISSRLVYTDIFPDPMYTRNDFYITLESGEFSQDMKTTARNVEIVCLFVDCDGQMKECISSCSSSTIMESTYRSAMYYHNNKPHFSEIFKISITEVGSAFFSSHILFLIYHCSSSNSKDNKSLFAFSVLMLAGHSDGITIADSTFTLQCYEVPEEMKGKDFSELRGVYFDEAVNLVPRTVRSGLSTVNESITISSKLISSSITQDQALHRLLNMLFEVIDDEEMAEVFNTCSSLSPFVLLSYLRSILDVCATAVSSSIHHTEPAFHFLVSVLDIFDNPAYVRHKSILQKYVDNVFDIPSFYRTILSRIDTVLLWLDYPTMTPNKVLNEMVLRVISSLLVLVHKSICRSLERVRGCEVKSFTFFDVNNTLDGRVFIGTLWTVLNRFTQLVGAVSNSDWIKSLKHLLLQQFKVLLNALPSLLPPTDIAAFVESFMDAYIASDIFTEQDDGNNPVALSLIGEIIEGNFFLCPPARAKIFNVVVSLLLKNLYFKNPNVIIVSQIVEKLMSRLNAIGFTDQDMIGVVLLGRGTLTLLYDQLVSSYTSSANPYSNLILLLTPTTRTFAITKRFDGVIITINIFSMLLDVLRIGGMCDLINRNSNPRGITYQLLSIIIVLIQQLHVLYPHCWLVVKLQVLKSIMRCLQVVYIVLQIHSDFDKPLQNIVATELINTCSEKINHHHDLNEMYLWVLAIEAVIYVIINPVFCIDEDAKAQSVSRIEYVRANYNDSRETMCDLLRGLWRHIEGTIAKVNLLNRVLPLVLLLAGSDSSQVRDVASTLLLDFLHADLLLHGNALSSTKCVMQSSLELLKVDKEAGSSADQLVAFERGIYIQFITDAFLCKVEADDALNIHEVRNLVEDLAYFIRLEDEFNFYRMEENCSEERQELALQMMAFCFDRGSLDQYYSILHSMALEFCKQQKFVEASYLLTCHAEQVPQDNSLLSEIVFGFYGTERLEAGLAWNRKAYLLETAVDLCDRDEAQDWERCVLLLDQLIQLYRSKNMSHGKIKDFLKRQIGFYDKIASEKRIQPSVFLVGYYGPFSEDLKNKQFVYRGKKLETISDFSAIFLKKYPGLVILKADAVITDYYLQNDNFFVQIIKLHPLELDNNCESINVFAPVKQFIYSFNTRRDPMISSEFLDLWITKRIVTVELQLPSITDRTEVIQAKTITILLNPVEVAYEALVNRDKLLEKCIFDMQCSGVASKNVTMDISGTVDSAVNGGIKQYFSIISGEYSSINPAIDADIAASPGKENIVKAFKQRIFGHLEILKQAISLHKDTCHESMRQLQTHFEFSWESLMEAVQSLNR